MKPLVKIPTEGYFFTSWRYLPNKTSMKRFKLMKNERLSLFVNHRTKTEVGFIIFLPTSIVMRNISILEKNGRPKRVKQSNNKINWFFKYILTSEEILNSNSALWFNPTGTHLAFATFNDTDVDTMNFPLYGRPGDVTFQYPLQQSIKYPKVKIHNTCLL